MEKIKSAKPNAPPQFPFQPKQENFTYNYFLICFVFEGGGKRNVTEAL